MGKRIIAFRIFVLFVLSCIINTITCAAWTQIVFYHTVICNFVIHVFNFIFFAVKECWINWKTESETLQVNIFFNKNYSWNMWLFYYIELFL